MPDRIELEEGPGMLITHDLISNKARKMAIIMMTHQLINRCTYGETARILWGVPSTTPEGVTLATPATIRDTPIRPRSRFEVQDFIINTLPGLVQVDWVGLKDSPDLQAPHLDSGWGPAEIEATAQMAQKTRRSRLRHAFPSEYWDVDEDDLQLESHAARTLERHVPETTPPLPGESARLFQQKQARARRKRLESLFEEDV